MSTKTYSVRVPQSATEVDSEQISTWLDEQLGSEAALTADPGAGPKVLRLTLDRAKVEQGSQVARESEAAFLRRLIATRTGLKPEPRESEQGMEPEDRPRPKQFLLPPRLRLTPEQLAPAVAAYDHLQALAISRAMQTPEAMPAARFTEEERAQLASATAEVANRRAPVWLIENADLFGLSSLLISIEFKKIDAAREVAERARAKRASNPSEQSASKPNSGTPGGMNDASQ